MAEGSVIALTTTAEVQIPGPSSSNRAAASLAAFLVSQVSSVKNFSDIPFLPRATLHLAVNAGCQRSSVSRNFPSVLMNHFGTDRSRLMRFLKNLRAEDSSSRCRTRTALVGMGSEELWVTSNPLSVLTINRKPPTEAVFFGMVITPYPKKSGILTFRGL